MAEDIDIFEDLQYQNFGDSQEYFDYLKERSKEYDEYASDPVKVAEDLETFKGQVGDVAKVPVNAAVDIANVLGFSAQVPAYIYNAFQEEQNKLPTLKAIPKVKYTNEDMQYVSAAVSLVGGPLGWVKALDLLSKKAPKVYQSLRKAYPYNVAQMHDSILTGGRGAWQMFKDIWPWGQKAKDMIINTAIISGGGMAAAGGKTSGLQETKEE